MSSLVPSPYSPNRYRPDPNQDTTVMIAHITELKSHTLVLSPSATNSNATPKTDEARNIKKDIIVSIKVLLSEII